MTSMDLEMHPLFYPLAAIYGAYCIVGVASNILIVFATLQSKNLRSSCNFLIATCSLFDAIHLASHGVVVYSIFSGHLFMDSWMCLFLQLPAIVGVMGSTVGVLSIGTDRMLSCAVPVWYKNKWKRSYTSMHFLPIIGYSSAMVCLILSNLNEGEVVCFLPLIIHGGAFPAWLLSSLGIYAASVVIYAVVFRVLRKSGQDHALRTLFRSLLIVLLFIVGGWTLTTIAGFTCGMTFEEDPSTRLLCLLFAGLPVNGVLTLNYAIYYTTSPIYRAAFKEQIRVVLRHFCFKENMKESRIQVISLATISAVHQATYKSVKL